MIGQFEKVVIITIQSIVQRLVEIYQNFTDELLQWKR